MQPPTDKGAHFFKCDFQVHTPRDRQWSGDYSEITTDVEREVFAKDLVADCRRKGIQAIAITDHHDFCMIPYIVKAAKGEKNADGTTISSNNKLIVFPGVELSLSHCQAIMIFSRMATEQDLAAAAAAIGFATAPSSDKWTIKTLQIDSGIDLETIQERLDVQTFQNGNRPKFEGHYIILPHVREGGHKSLLLKGIFQPYRDMPWHGGYIEKHFYTELSAGNRDILEGKSNEWGSKAIGVLQTSDSRVASKNTNGNIIFPDLGKWPTWVKWSEPTPEALRQAFLARTSRIEHVEPKLPSSRILGVKVTDSKFLGAVDLSLNPQFNALIGGRGTGKSTVFEYIRWALFEESKVQTVNDELPNYEQRRKSLIQNTLEPRNGEVTVWYEKNGACFTITRSSASKNSKAKVTSEDETEREMSDNEIRRVFPISGYGQKQLSSIGSLRDEVYRLLEAPIAKQVASIESEITEILPLLKLQQRRLLRRTDISNQLKQLASAVKTLDDQSEALRKGLKEQDADSQGVLKSHSGFLSRKAWIDDLNLSLKEITDVLRSAHQTIGAVPDSIVPSLPDSDALKKIGEAFNNSKKIATDVIASIIRQMGEEVQKEEITTAKAIIKASDDDHASKYAAILAEDEHSESIRQKLDEIEHEKLALMAKIATIEHEQRPLIDVENEIDVQQIKWVKLINDRTALLNYEADKMTREHSHDFRVEVKPNGDERPIQEELRKLLSYAKNVRGIDDKVAKMAQDIVDNDDPIAFWYDVYSELERLVSESIKFETSSFPKLTANGWLSSANAESFRSGIKSDQLVEFRYLSFNDSVKFEFALSAREGKYIPFEQASQGQQATAMLRTLLRQDGPPLLIDQPEEDIANEHIGAITDAISEAKSKRQLLFVSHNANIVVNGDAELIVVMGYPNIDDQSSSKIVAEGSIDSSAVRHRIAEVMEGGKEAFELRAQKYGF